jgi:hypothetical protein
VQQKQVEKERENIVLHLCNRCTERKNAGEIYVCVCNRHKLRSVDAKMYFSVLPKVSFCSLNEKKKEEHFLSLSASYNYLQSRTYIIS